MRLHRPRRPEFYGSRPRTSPRGWAPRPTVPGYVPIPEKTDAALLAYYRHQTSFGFAGFGWLENLRAIERECDRRQLDRSLPEGWFGHVTRERHAQWCAERGIDPDDWRPRYARVGVVTRLRWLVTGDWRLALS